MRHRAPEIRLRDGPRPSAVNTCQRPVVVPVAAIDERIELDVAARRPYLMVTP